MIILTKFQQDIADKVCKSLNEYDYANIAYLTPGSGKTTISLSIAQNYQNVWIIVSRLYLINCWIQAINVNFNRTYHIYDGTPIMHNYDFILCYAPKVRSSQINTNFVISDTVVPNNIKYNKLLSLISIKESES